MGDNARVAHDTDADRASDDAARRVRRVGWLLVSVQIVLLALLVVLPRRGSLAWPPGVLEVLGVALMVGGLTLLLMSLVTMGSALTPTPVPVDGAALRTAGIYSVVRHPIYVGLLIAALGFTIAVGSLWQVLILLVLCVFLYAKSFWEDRLLAERHGATWFDYADHVGGFVPHLRGNR